MADEVKKPKLEVVPEELDEDEAEFRKLRRDLPGVKGASAVGIVSIGVGKIPGKNEFFRTHKEFRPVVPLVNVEVGMEKQYFAVDDDMVVALAGIGISVADHTLLPDRDAARGCADHPDPLRQRQRLQPNEGDRAARRYRAVGAALHRPGKQGLQGFSGSGRTLCRPYLAGIEAREDLPVGLPR